MAFITNLEEVIPVLRERLRDYLTLKLDLGPGDKKFKCFLHDDNNPSMYFNPKTGEQTVHCFSCGGSADIFSACAHIEGMPGIGPEWVTETIPHLAQLLKVPLQAGEPTNRDKEKLKLYKLGSDISDILGTTTLNRDYLEERGWTTDDITTGSIPEEELISRLMEMGWSSTDIVTSLMVKTSKHGFFGEDKVTFTIRDFRGRAVGFVSRVIEAEGSGKYINSHETTIYEKRSTLLGLDTALRKGRAKMFGLYVVEGPGDLAQLYRIGIYNAVAACGTAVTSDHLNLLKMLGINTLYLCLDWDAAGAIATQRILKDEFKGVTGLSPWVILGPEGQDVDGLMKGEKGPDKFKALQCVSGFEWLMRNMSDNQDPVAICEELIPTIAAELTAIRREILAKTLADYTKISLQSIMSDVEILRSGRVAERKDRLLSAVKRYASEVESDPENVRAIMSQHEEDLAYIEKEYQRDVIGPNYQLARFDALQAMRTNSLEGEQNGFILKHLSFISEVFSGGMDWAHGVQIYLGGRANSGKTATGLAIAIDVALHDPNAIVIIHSTDDSYTQIEPRLKTNIAMMTAGPGNPRLTIGMASNPNMNCTEESQVVAYYRANQTLRELLANEKLIILDNEDGSTLSTLEKNLRYVRSRYPSKKILAFCDNTHNYRDFTHLDQTSRMTRISTIQKDFTGKYGCCMIATVEYRKNMPFDTSKIRLPVDDDIADARSLMYRPNAIIHVYNDSHDRKEHAEIFWKDPSRPELKMPRLMLLFTKNKLTAFKDKLIMDLDVDTVTLIQRDKDDAYAEYERYVEMMQEPAVTIDTGYGGA